MEEELRYITETKTPELDVSFSFVLNLHRLK